MKHNILPESWCVAKCESVIDYLNKITKEGTYEGSTKYYGVVGGCGDYSNNKPFGQLLTEEQFLYCIGEPVEGEEIEVSNTDFESEELIVNFFGRCRDGAIITEAQTMDFYENYRRKPLQFEIDKWAKEKAAFAEGKTIQSRDITGDNDWVIAELPKWHSWKEYRIKPESKYAPFTREDWDLFKMKEVRNNPDNGVVVVIISCDNDGVRCGRVECTYESAFDSIVFADGTPFGKLIEE